jgi:protein-disulfide isomerase
MMHRDALVPARPHVRGDVEAPVTVVEFGDFECPFCRDAAPLLDELVATSNGKIRLVWRHFPLFELHPHALPAALAAEAAASQERFWEMHDALFAHQGDLSDAALVSLARETGVGESCVVGETAQQFGDPVEEDYADGLAHGVAGTPAIFVNGVRFEGRVTRDRLRAAVEALKLTKSAVR